MEWSNTAPAFAVGLAGALGGWICAAGMRARGVRTAQGFAAGVMLALSCMSLLPESFDRLPAGWVMVCTALGMGVLAVAQGGLGRMTGDAQAWTVILGIAAHNIPEGMVIGAGMAAEPTLGWSLAGAILLHDIPEGAAVALPMKARGRGRWKTLGMTLLAGLPTGVGAMIGAGVGSVSEGAMGASLAFAAGAMLWVSLGALLPESSTEKWSGMAACMGTLAGTWAARM